MIKNKVMIYNLNFDLICCINRFIVVWFGKEDVVEVFGFISS